MPKLVRWEGREEGEGMDIKRERGKGCRGPGEVLLYLLLGLIFYEYDKDHAVKPILVR